MKLSPKAENLRTTVPGSQIKQMFQQAAQQAENTKQKFIQFLQ